MDNTMQLWTELLVLNILGKGFLMTLKKAIS